jgi:hypothetical protein
LARIAASDQHIPRRLPFWYRYRILLVADRPWRRGTYAGHPCFHQDVLAAAGAGTGQGELAQLAVVDDQYRGQFAYVIVELTGRQQLPVMRLRYSGSAHRWHLATYRTSNNSYEDQYWFSGTTEGALDFVCDVLISFITDSPLPDPEPSTPKDFRTEALSYLW